AALVRLTRSRFQDRCSRSSSVALPIFLARLPSPSAPRLDFLPSSTPSRPSPQAACIFLRVQSNDQQPLRWYGDHPSSTGSVLADRAPESRHQPALEQTPPASAFR